MSRPRVVLTTRELHPFPGGGIGVYAALLARTLGPVADVTLVAPGTVAEDHRRLVAAADPRVDYGGAEVVFVDVPQDPTDTAPFSSEMLRYSAGVLEAVRGLAREAPIDLVEVTDHFGEGFFLTEARRSGDPALRDAVLAARLHTTGEMCDVLNGRVDRAFGARLSYQVARRSLHAVDALLAAGGDIAATYGRFHGAALAPVRQVRHPLDREAFGDPGPAPDGPLRLVYLGRLETRKGVDDLLAALLSIPAQWQLTILGSDTPTGPLRSSVAAALRARSAGDPRVRFVEAQERSSLPELLAEHDAVVMPSRWECWPYVGLETLAGGLPLVATPVGGLVELVDHGTTGWRTTGVGPGALRDVLEPLVRDPGEARALRGTPALRAHVEALTDPDAIRASYLELSDRPRRARRARSGESPLVSVVVPYFKMHEFVEEAVDSVLAQSYGRIETIVVDDGSFGGQDRVLAVLAGRAPVRVVGRPNGGLSAARNFGIAVSRGRYVLPLDADNVLDATFVERCVAVLEEDDDVAYVTSWNRYVDRATAPVGDGYRPVGNWTDLVLEENVAGDANALLRRRLCDRFPFDEQLAAYEDWGFYQRLHAAGLYGQVIPEVLWSYRLRDESMLRRVGLPHDAELRDELAGSLRRDDTRWLPTNA